LTVFNANLVREFSSKDKNEIFFNFFLNFCKDDFDGDHAYRPDVPHGRGRGLGVGELQGNL